VRRVSAQEIQAAAREGRPPAIPAAPRFAPGQILVRFADSVLSPAEIVFAARASFAEHTADRSTGLDALFLRFGVRGVHPIVREPVSSEGPVPAVQELRAADEAARSAQALRFAGRAARAPQAAAAPALHHLYALDLAPEADVLAAAAAFAADPHVESAEPNAVYEIALLPKDRFVDPDGDGRPGFDEVDIDTAAYVAQGFQLDPMEDYKKPDFDPVDRPRSDTWWRCAPTPRRCQAGPCITSRRSPPAASTRRISTAMRSPRSRSRTEKTFISWSTTALCGRVGRSRPIPTCETAPRSAISTVTAGSKSPPSRRPGSSMGSTLEESRAPAGRSRCPPAPHWPRRRSSISTAAGSTSSSPPMEPASSPFMPTARRSPAGRPPARCGPREPEPPPISTATAARRSSN
jgi:hypothetical protein